MIFKIFVLACITAVCFGEETEISERIIKTIAAGGEIQTYKKNNNTYAVTAKVVSVKEILTDASAAGNYSGAVHSFPDLSQTTFTPGALVADNENYTGSTIPTSKLSLSADLNIDTANSHVATLKLELTIFKEQGEIQMDGATTYIHAGDVMLDVTVKNWAFCGSNDVICDNGLANVTGEFLEVALDVTGMESATLKTGSTKMYMLGARSSYTVSNMVTYGTGAAAPAPVAMPSSYPMNAGSVFTSRLEASSYNTSAMYGSLISLGREDVFFDKTELKILGQSGKMTYFMKDDDNKKITIEFDNLKERQRGGEKIQEKGHTFNTFASQDFTIHDVGQTTYQGLSVKQTTFSAQLKDTPATLTVHTYLFLEAGKVTNLKENYTLRAGAMKFTVEIENWKFCGSTGTSCKKDMGEWLDFDIVIKGKGDQVNAKIDTDTSNGKDYDLGYGTLTLSRQIEKDGNGTEMAEDYPKLLTQGSKKIFQFRFPKFATKLLYDPNAELYTDGGDGGDGSSGGDGPSGGSARLSVMGSLLLALSLTVQRLLF